jgi:segregation and condensation protein B
MLSKADIIEALLFAADKPVPLKQLAQIAGLQPREALAEIDVLREEKERIGALQIVEVAGGWQIVTKPEYSSFIRQLREAPRQRLSRAAFEVLAIVAYRQPATRAEIEALRGVDCAGSLQFLLEKKLITFAGRKEAPGRPWLYATTTQFLDNFGLRDIADLPSLAEFAELNDAAGTAEGEAGNGSRNLFARGAMKSVTSTGESREALDEPVAEHEIAATESPENS